MYIYFVNKRKFLTHDLSLDYDYKNANFIGEKLEDNFYIKLNDQYLSIENDEITLSKNKTSFSSENEKIIFCNNPHIFDTIILNIFCENRDHNLKDDIVNSFIKFLDSNNIEHYEYDEYLSDDGIFSGIYVCTDNILKLEEWNFAFQYDNIFINGNIFKINDNILNISNDDVDQEFKDAIRDCYDYEILRELKNGLKNPLFVDDKGNNALMIALLFDLTNAAIRIINSVNIDYLNMLNNLNQNALVIAISKKFEDIACLLIEKGADVNLVSLCFELSLIFKMNKLSRIMCPLITNIEEYFDLAVSRKNIHVSNFILRLRFNKNREEITSLILACKHADEEKANLFLNENISYIDAEGYSALMYACINNMKDIAIKLLNKGANYEKIENYTEDEGIILKIKELHSCILLSNQIQLFSYDDFTKVTKLGRGSYSTTEYAINNQTRKRYVIKKSTRCGSNRIIPGDIVRELYLLKQINREFEDICVIVYGVIFDSNCMYLVLEDCGILISDYFSNLDHVEKMRQFIPIFSKILNNLYKLNLMGIIHYDLHYGNILISGGKIKFIDTGISKFQGIYPLENNINELFDYRPWRAFDNESENIVHNGKVLIDKSNINWINYSFDVFSVGVLMLQVMFDTYGTGYFVTDDGDIMEKYDDKIEKIDYCNEHLKELIVHMLHPDSKQRFTAKEVLSHPYFSEMNGSPGIPIDDKHESKNKLFYKLFRAKYIHPNRLDNEHIISIHNTYKHGVIKYFPFENKYDFIEEALSFFSKSPISFNVVFNAIFASFQYNTNNVDKDYFIHCYLYIYSCIFDYFENDILDAMEIHFTPNFSNFILEEIKTKDITFYPVTVHFDYILTQMKIHGDMDIQVNYNYMMYKFISFLFLVDYDFNPWNVISVIMKNRVPFLDLDLSNHDKISNTLKQPDDQIAGIFQELFFKKNFNVY